MRFIKEYSKKVVREEKKHEGKTKKVTLDKGVCQGHQELHQTASEVLGTEAVEYLGLASCSQQKLGHLLSASVSLSH
jgi:hypothetical protein